MRVQIEELVYRSCISLDAKDFDGYLALCAADFRYTVRAYAPELRRDMTWLDVDLIGMTTLFHTLPRHHSDAAPLTRHATVYTVTFSGRDTRAEVVTGVMVFRTSLDGGSTSLLAVGKLHDTVVIEGGRALLAARTVRLDTRELGIGSHIPF